MKCNSLCFVSTEGIESVMVKNNTVPINLEDFTLTCEVIGPYTSISWMINTSIDNKLLSYNMLNFTPVTLNNDGTYRCIATDKAGSHESPEYKLLVNCEYCRKQWSGFFILFYLVFFILSSFKKININIIESQCCFFKCSIRTTVQRKKQIYNMTFSIIICMAVDSSINNGHCENTTFVDTVDQQWWNYFKVSAFACNVCIVLSAHVYNMCYSGLYYFHHQKKGARFTDYSVYMLVLYWMRPPEVLLLLMECDRFFKN